MAWSLTAAQRAELRRADADIRRQVRIHADSDWDLYFIEGETNVGAAVAKAAEISDASIERDPFTAEHTVGEMTVTIQKSARLLRMLRSVVVIGKHLQVSLVTPELGSIATLWNGTIRDYDIDDAGTVTIYGEDGFGYLASIDITGGWSSMHPLAIAADIMDNAATTGVTGSTLANLPSDLFDVSTFNFEDYTSISHWNLSRWEVKRENPNTLDPRAEYFRTGRIRRTVTFKSIPTDDSTLYRPTNAMSLVQELMSMLNAVIQYDTSGRITFSRYNPSGAAVRHFDRSLISDWKQISAGGENIANRITINFGGTTRSFRAPEPEDRSHTANYETSQTNHAYPSGPDRIFPKSLDNQWIRAQSKITNAIDDNDTSITIQDASNLGFSGARWRNGYRNNSASAGLPSAPGMGGIAVSSGEISGGALATLECAGHWLQTGDYITTSGLSTNQATPTACTVIDSDTITVPMVGPNGALGDGYIHPEQMPLDQLSSGTREAYFMLITVNSEDEEIVEVVRATAASVPADTRMEPTGANLSSGSLEHTAPFHMSFTIVRAQLGTSAAAFPAQNTRVIDITIPVQQQTDRITRFANGAPMVSFKTPRSEVDVLTGDKFTHDAPNYRANGSPAAGADSTTVFEATARVVGRDHIQWTGCLAFQNSYSELTPTYDAGAQPIPVGVQTTFSPFSVFFAASSPRFLEAPAHASLVFTSEFTVSFWLNPGPTITDSTCVIGKWQDSEREWRVLLISDGSLRLHIASTTSDAGGNYAETDAGVVVANTWSHFVFTYHSGTIAAYQDLTAINTADTGTIDATLSGGDSVLQIGANGNDAEVLAGGHVAHVALFDREVSGTDIGRLSVVAPFAGRVPANPTGIAGLVSWWPFPQTFSDAVGANTLSIEGGGSNDPQFSTEYPP